MPTRLHLPLNRVTQSVPATMLLICGHCSQKHCMHQTTVVGGCTTIDIVDYVTQSIVFMDVHTMPSAVDEIMPLY